MSRPTDRTDWEQWVDAITLNGVNCTTWELEFVESMQARLQAGRQLTEKQADILERIYAERTP